MSTSETIETVILQRTEEPVPRKTAIETAMLVYLEYSQDISTSDRLARLAFIAANGYSPDDIDSLLTDDDLTRLEVNRYLDYTTRDLAKRATFKAAIALNMINSEQDEDGFIENYIVEPFIGVRVIDTFYHTYMSNRRLSSLGNLDDSFSS